MEMERANIRIGLNHHRRVFVRERLQVFIRSRRQTDHSQANASKARTRKLGINRYHISKPQGLDCCRRATALHSAPTTDEMICENLSRREVVEAWASFEQITTTLKIIDRDNTKNSFDCALMEPTNCNCILTCSYLARFPLCDWAQRSFAILQ
jgi:hypothetical protein